MTVLVQFRSTLVSGVLAVTLGLVSACSPPTVVDPPPAACLTNLPGAAPSAPLCLAHRAKLRDTLKELQPQDDQKARLEIRAQLCMLGDTTMLPEVLRDLRSEDPLLRFRARLDLIRIAPHAPEAEAEVRTLLHERPLPERNDFILALAAMQSPDADPLLAAAIRGQQLSAVEFAHVKDEHSGARAQLRQVVRLDPRPWYRTLARERLKRFESVPDPALIECPILGESSRLGYRNEEHEFTRLTDAREAPDAAIQERCEGRLSEPLSRYLRDSEPVFVDLNGECLLLWDHPESGGGAAVYPTEGMPYLLATLIHPQLLLQWNGKPWLIDRLRREPGLGSLWLPTPGDDGYLRLDKKLELQAYPLGFWTEPRDDGREDLILVLWNGYPWECSRGDAGTALVRVTPQLRIEIY